MRTLVLLTTLTLALAGCSGELIPYEPGPGNPGGGPDAGGVGGTPDAGGDPLAAKAYFDEMVQPLLIQARPLGACTVCHAGTNIVDGPDFFGLTPADSYTTLMTQPRIVAPGNPAGSLLVTRGVHTGDAFPAAEKAIIDQWILMEPAR